MPDWSYHPLKKILLNNLETRTSREFIHRSMSTIASIPGGRSLISFLGHMKPSPEIQKEISHTVFPSPVGLSGYIDPKLTGINAFQELGFGFIEIGPIVLNEPNVQKEPRIEDGTILFSTQEEKVPLKLVIQKLTSLHLQIPIIARIDKQVKQKEWDIIVQHLTPFVAGFIGTNEQINTFSDERMYGLKRSFYVSLSSEDIDDGIDYKAIDGVVIHAPHKTLEYYWHEAENPTNELAKLVKQVRKQHPELTIITSGGIETPEEARTLVQAGADLMMLTDGYVKAGPGLPKRIHERLLVDKVGVPKKQNWHWSLLFALSIITGGIIAFYFALTSVILPYDESFIGITRADILQVNPLILSFMLHDRMSLAGTMISGGILYFQLARHGIKYGLHWTKITFHSAAITGFLGILLFIGYGYFDWLHGLFWLILLPIYYFSFKEGKNVTTAPYSSHGTNDYTWKLGLYGQLMFILLGFMIIVGGVVISFIGVSNVFVATDLSFLCMSPEMLNQISTNLIPVIAHDRAGFGGALISVGLLVLMISLWGFRKGERWIWNTLAIGALPAFIAGMGTHIYIGYTTFIHLLPVYILIILYILGLVFSYPFLKRQQ